MPAAASVAWIPAVDHALLDSDYGENGIMSTPDLPHPRPALTAEQQGRFDLDTAALASARQIDVVAIPRHHLVLAFSRLQTSLDDALRLVEELADQATPGD